MREAADYLKDGGYLLFPVLSIARSEKIINVAEEMFEPNPELLKTKMIPFNEELKHHIDILEKQQTDGIIHFEKRRSRYMWTLYIYKATKPQLFV